MTTAQAADILGGAGIDLDNEVPPPGMPMGVARHLLPAWMEGEHLILRHWRGQWMKWHGSHWAEMDAAEIKATAYTELEHARYIGKDKKGDLIQLAWAPTKRKIGDLMDAMSAITILSATVDAPAWTSGCAPDTAGPIVACTNGLLHVPTRELLPLTPEFFNLVSVPFDYNAEAPEPRVWLDFLAKNWPDDPDSIALLQEYFGYVISGRTDMHKILLIVGPTRSGKGTIARAQTALVGKGNMAGPTLASLTQNFGLSSLLGKPLAVVSDARMSGRDGQQVVERLLTISGEDTIDVDRKYRDLWTGRLPTRFLILSNELPNFGDASGAIAHRFAVLTMTASWLGKEDRSLESRINAELSGILNWSLEGLDRLTRNGRFTEPDSSRQAVTLLQDQASPMSAFIRDSCTTGAGLSVAVDDLFAAWKAWCEDSNRDKPGSKQLFSRNLQAVVPQAKVYRPHGQPRRYDGIEMSTGSANNGKPSGSSGSEDQKGTPEPQNGAPSGSGRPHRRQGESAGQEDMRAGDEPREPLEPLDQPLFAQPGTVNRSSGSPSGSSDTLGPEALTWLLSNPAAPGKCGSVLCVGGGNVGPRYRHPNGNGMTDWCEPCMRDRYGHDAEEQTAQTEAAPDPRPKTPCANCSKPQWNAQGSPHCYDCRTAA